MRHRRSPPGAFALGLLAVVLSPAGGSAQDVELLGRIYGTRPPEGYYEQLRRNPNSFQFSREGPERLQRLRDSPILRGSAPVLPQGPTARSIGPRQDPVAGDFRVPLVLGLFSDGPLTGPYPRARMEEEFFTGPNSYGQTLSELYGEMSGGLLNLQGVAFDWVQTGLTRQSVTLGNSGLNAHPTQGVGRFIEAIVQNLSQSGVDWSQFDVSGDGYVDVLTVMHPFRGAECTGGGADIIWSHRWNLAEATADRLSRGQTGKARDGIETTTPYSGGGFIHINDYTVQAALACGSEPPPAGPFQINQIGVFAHELGHAFGLPDLYPTQRQPHAGVGNWDLMGTGAWGCQPPSQPAFPCHFGAWSRAALGWALVEEFPADQEEVVILEPVQQSGRLLRIPAMDGSREYLLLENRQRIGSQANLHEPGLLIWHVDPDVLDPFWPENTVNVNPQRMGVWLREADGQNHMALPIQWRGDPGDPFPGCIKPSILSNQPDLGDYGDPTIPCVHNRAFHAGSNPAAVTHAGTAMGIAITDIQMPGAAPHDIVFRLNTRFQWDTVFVAVVVEAAKAQSVPLEVVGAPPAVSWRFAGGALPQGITVLPGEARLTGSTFHLGTFHFELVTADGFNRELRALVEVQVIPPVLAQEDLVATFLGKPNVLPAELRSFLDFHGNQNGGFDLGDVRAYLQANSGLPEGGSGAPSPVPAAQAPPLHPWQREDP